MMEFNRILVVGAGLMGSGIAQVCAQSGLKVDLYDLSREALDKAFQSISWSVGKLVEKGQVPGSAAEIMGRISLVSGLETAGEADLVIEAVFENLEVKKEVFNKIDQAAGPHTILATNTSAIPVTVLAAGLTRPEQMLGLHFFSPAPLMAAVEVVRAMTTNDQTFQAGREFVLRVGKTPIMVHKDVPGFLINRINFPSTMEAMRLVEAGVGTVEDIDLGLKLASGRRMGIFETGDMVGLDVTHGALMAMYEDTKDPRWYPPQMLRRKVKLGHLGKKTGRGWYVYDENGRRLGPAD
jgi:3-hydroxybutyryl-CoA dehydrogenase